MSDGSTQGATAQGVAPAGPKLYRLTISQVTSVLLISFRKTMTKTGTVEELEQFYRQVLTHNLVAGWWAFPVGLIWNPMALSRNKKALGKLHDLAAAATPAAPSVAPATAT